jgi:hypothetical protein
VLVLVQLREMVAQVAVEAALEELLVVATVAVAASFFTTNS